MQFETLNIYHIYNQGNNRQPIFFSRENYLYFLKKMKEYLLPYVDILAWCLMPNHFHWMVYVREADAVITDGVTPSHPVSNARKRTLNESIGIMLRSYTRAINKQETRNGALFREATKAVCVTKTDGITPSFYRTSINVHRIEEEYPQQCFNYIHNNPVSVGLVESATAWEFSSAEDYYGNRGGKLINKNVAKRFGLV
jgi:putative transposase